MEYLLSIIQPKIGVFLNALPVHGKYFDHLVPEQITTPEERRQAITDFIAAEKAKLITALPSDGFAILNIDDDRVKMWKEKTKAKVITVSARTYAQIQAKAFQINQSGIAMEVKEGKKSASLVLQQYLDESYANTLLCAIAVGRALDVSLENCVHSLKTNFHTPPGRMNLLAGIKHTTIIDSSYNASRQTTMNALELLNQIAKKRRVAILGDMLEMGEISRLEHEQVAEVANDCTDLVITVGEMMGNYFIPKLLSFGYPRANCVSFLNTYELAEKIKGFINQEDTILVKGSQNGLYLEVIVQALMLNKTQADSLLCRRGGFWDKKREKLNASYLSSV
jgi:UDP-N-acetylmuramoyl-tripeptide--D-alanyl-D-alanine ligase